MYRVAQVTVLENFRLELVFSDGTQGVVDLSQLAGKGVFRIWNDYDCFRQVRIGDVGELAWGDKADLCPGSLYLKATGKTPEEIFPALRHRETHA